MPHKPLEISYCTEQTILSFGGQLKNTFCFLKNNQAFISPHIGNIDNLDTINHCQNTIEKYRQLFKLEEQLLSLRPSSRLCFNQTGAANQYSKTNSFN